MQLFFAWHRVAFKVGSGGLDGNHRERIRVRDLKKKEKSGWEEMMEIMEMYSFGIVERIDSIHVVSSGEIIFGNNHQELWRIARSREKCVHSSPFIYNSSEDKLDAVKFVIHLSGAVE